MTYPGQCDDCPGRSGFCCRNTEDQRPPHISEIARLMQCIAAEYEAAQNALSGFASGAAQHRFITARMERMNTLRQELAEEIGDIEATAMLFNVLEAQ